MSDEKQTSFSAFLALNGLTKIFEVESRNGSFTGTSGGNYKIFIGVNIIALKLQFFEHLDLMNFSFEADNILRLDGTGINSATSMAPNGVFEI
jgi:hypothetical protein